MRFQERKKERWDGKDIHVRMRGLWMREGGRKGRKRDKIGR